jgi:hypothetical protein
MWQGKPYHIKPFNKLSGKELPNKQLATDLDTKWKPIYRKNEDFVRTSYDVCTAHLKTVAGYIWLKAKHEKVLEGYTIGTWSRKVSRSEIAKRYSSGPHQQSTCCDSTKPERQGKAWRLAKP